MCVRLISEPGDLRQPGLWVLVGLGRALKLPLNLAGDSLDPQLQDVINRCSFWRRFLRRFPNLKENFLHMLNVGGVCNRPGRFFV